MEYYAYEKWLHKSDVIRIVCQLNQHNLQVMNEIEAIAPDIYRKYGFYGLRFSLSQTSWSIEMDGNILSRRKNQTRQRIIIVTKEWSKYTKIMLFGSRRLLFGDAGAHRSTHTLDKACDLCWEQQLILSDLFLFCGNVPFSAHFHPFYHSLLALSIIHCSLMEVALSQYNIKLNWMQHTAKVSFILLVLVVFIYIYT